MTAESRFLTLEEVAQLTNLALSYIYRLSAEGRLPGKVKFGARTIRVDRLKLMAWLEAQAGRGEAEGD